MRIETISNFYRDQQHQLSSRQIDALTALGWNLPTREDSTPANDPNGSSNHYVDVQQPLNFEQVANLIVRTMQEILKVSLPKFLRYECLDETGDALYLPSLGIRSSNLDAASQFHNVLQDTVGQVSTDTYFDDDQDLVTGYGETPVFIRVLKKSNALRLFALLVREIELTPAVCSRINELNGGSGGMHLYYESDAVLAMAEIPTKPFVKTHLLDMLPEFSGFVDWAKSVLQAEFAQLDLVTLH